MGSKSNIIMIGLAWLAFTLVVGTPSVAGTVPGYPVDEETPLEVLTRLFAPHLLKEKTDRPNEHGYCGVDVLAMVTEHWSRMTPELQQHVPDRFRPSRFRENGPNDFRDIDVCDAHLDSEHFRVHYSTQPEHLPPGYPDLHSVHELAEYLETAYSYHRDVSGMGVAFPDGDHGGGQDLIDCYFFDIGEVWGWAHGVERTGEPCENSFWGYMAVAIDFDSYDFSNQLRLTSEHEYYHLLQYSINGHQSSWFDESTARNSEFHVWPEIAVPRGAWSWMTHPYYSLSDGSGIHKYAPHFWFYLEAHHGRDFVTRLWNRCCDQRSEVALVDQLEDLGSDLDTVLTDFALWNYFTGERDDGEHYEPGSGLTAVYHQAGHSRFPVTAVRLPADKIARPAGSNYIRFSGPASRNNLRVTVNGHSALAGHRAVTVLGVNAWGHQAWILEPDANGDVECTVPDWGLFDYVTLVVSNFWNAPRDSASLHYSYSAEEVDQPAGPANSARLVKSSPNPFRNSTRVVYYTPRDGVPSSIRIFDLAGRLVRTLQDGSNFTGLHQVVWDGRDENGKLSATGMYFMRLEYGQDHHTGKVMFVR